MSTEPAEVTPREWASTPVEFIMAGLIAFLLGVVIGATCVYLQQAVQLRKAADRAQRAEEALQREKPESLQLKAQIAVEEESTRRTNQNMLIGERNLKRALARVAEAQEELRRLRGEKDAPAPAPH